jgi:outer membrane protein assembly factor BamB
MARSHRAWFLGFLAVVAALAAAVVVVIGRRRDRPPLTESSDGPPRAAAAEDALAPNDWPQFRGLRRGHADSGANIPFTWSDTENVCWKTDLPGPGSSSPIVVGDRVFVTCYSGYGTDQENPGDVNDLKRHLVCLSRSDGQIAWTTDVPAVVPENPFRGYLTEHGYASQTPVSDGEAVYAFFGKSGVLAYDLDGNQLWHTSVGTRSDSANWGSAGSPILYHNLVIVNAASESRSIRALDKRTGDQIWEAPAESLNLSFGTPAPINFPDGRTELALCVPGELWGLNPDTGTLNWYATVRMTGNVSPSVSVHDGIVFATGGYQSRGTVAVAAGGRGNVTGTHVRWSVRESTYVPSPLWHDGYLYWVDDKGIAVCLNAETGRVVYEKRLPLRGRGGRAVYASPVRVEDKLIVVTRTAGTVILAARPEYQLIATNRLTDTTHFNATPAIAGNQLLLRSNRAVYCISAEPAGR